MPKMDKEFWETVDRVSDKLAKAKNAQIFSGFGHEIGQTRRTSASMWDEALAMLLGQRPRLRGAGLRSSGKSPSWQERGTPAYGKMRGSAPGAKPDYTEEAFVGKYGISPADLMKGYQAWSRERPKEEIYKTWLEGRKEPEPAEKPGRDYNREELGDYIKSIQGLVGKGLELTPDQQAAYDAARKQYHKLLGMEIPKEPKPAKKEMPWWKAGWNMLFSGLKPSIASPPGQAGGQAPAANVKPMDKQALEYARKYPESEVSKAIIDFWRRRLKQ